MKSAKHVLSQAKSAAQSAQTWADLSNALFDPESGLLTQAYPNRAERERFVKTDQYQKIRALLNQAISSSGLVTGAKPKKSGRFVVRLPQTMHASLEREAAAEGVSLNQLVVAKLAIPLENALDRKLTRTRK
jgi:predicted HicB family RNase H-like nuclease